MAVIALVFAVASFECSRHPSPSEAHGATTRASAESSSTRPAEFRDTKFGIAFDLPAGWSPKSSKDYVLVLSPGASSATDPAAPTLSLDVPDLPPHIPGMIPISPVVKGYLDDLRQQEGSIETHDEAAPKMPGAQARLVRSTWDKGTMQETALLLVHRDHVYIVRGTSRVSDETSTRDALNTIIDSIRWVTAPPTSRTK
jgi:hypothetical protein